MIAPNRFLSRRGFARILALAPLCKLAIQPPLRAARLQWRAQPDAGSGAQRRYRADAQIVLLSVPLLRRAGVGAGSAAWAEETGLRLLEFTGYSLPERAAGLNRLGLIREMSRARAESETIYFGVMTASPEDSAAEARKALHQQSRTVVYSAIEGRVAPGQVETATAHFTAPAAARREELARMAQEALSSAPAKPPDFDARAATAQTFLQSLAALLQNPGPSETRCIYNGRLYRLSLHKTPDPKAAAYFRERRLIAQNARVIRAEGKLRREAGGKETSFRVWIEEAAARPLPLRIEYQAKSYLRLMFEAE